MTLKKDPNFEKKLLFDWKMPWGIFKVNDVAKFKVNGGKSENFHFEGLLL